MYIANEHLRNGTGAIAFPTGAEVPEEALKSEVAKANGWKDLVSESRTKTLRADGAGTDKPAKVEAPVATPNRAP